LRSHLTSCSIAVLALATVLVSSEIARAAAACDPPAAIVVSVQGLVEAKTAGASAWQPVGMDDEFCTGDSIRTSADSRADILLGDQSVLRVREQTTLVVQGATEESGSYVLDLLQGAAHFFSRQGARNLRVQTPYTVAGVRGTEFGVEVAEGSATVRVFEGSVLASNEAGSVILADGQTVVAEEGKPPVLRIEARPRDAVRWTLYYPPVLAPAASSDAVDTSKAQSLARRASERLAVGSIEAASADVDAALALDPDDADALALRTVIAVAQNDKDTATAASDAAVAKNPSSSSALVAQSYARQARFDLDGARASLERAVEVAPDNALAWARLAEIRSSVGDTRGALAAAERAASIDPGLARTQTVLGFSHLTRVEIDAARAAFEKAIRLDPADPLPRLGLGLAKIRNGYLRDGGREVEIAASLDPNNALVRSYLGKVYFEEKRTHLDEREYAVAKELDPQDPTPWFYDAIAKQTTNRPVEALRNYEKAIELNDNRAVYRSRLLLDGDLAARSAALGRVYGDLGFQSLALVEGWKSVNTDPSNYSAHRLLADSYAAQPRHEIARVSELLQSQMLQPLNTTPIQPRLGEASLFLLSAQGSANQSFQEFNPMFARDGLTLQTTGMLGEDDTASGEAVVSGIVRRASFSLGYSGFTTDGFRTNNDQSDNIATLFTQYEITPQTSIQGEIRHRDLQNGDLELSFFKDDFSRSLNQDTKTTTGRLGLRHSFSPNSILLASYVHGDSDGDSKQRIGEPDPDLGNFRFGIDVEEKGDSGELQHIFRWRPSSTRVGWLTRVDVTTGVGHTSVDVDETLRAGFEAFPPDIARRSPDVTHTNVYLYSNVGLPFDLTLTLGVSGDFFDEDDGVGKENQANPKAGVTWNPSFSPGTTVRAAAFRVLKRTLLNQQTLEPTQVAGFNQFYDDLSASDAWRYGVAVDQKFTDAVFGGVELSKRDLEVPGIFLTDQGDIDVVKDDWDEYLARTYLYFTPHEWVSARIEYDFEKMKRDPDSFASFDRVKTHRVPFGLSVFHPSGLSWSFGATYLYQDGKFLRDADFTYESGDRDLWVLDTGLRYRLPQRYGFVSVGVNNLLDEDSTYQATDPLNPTLRPGRLIFGSVTLALP
jgi:tetratricopeptide (TPR) repeat protein